MPNEDHMPKLGPREVGVPTNPNKAHILLMHLLALGFCMFRVFNCFSIIKMPSSLIVTQFRRHVIVTSVLRDKLPLRKLVFFHAKRKQFLVFYIN